MDKVEVVCEIKEVKVKKLVSNDLEYRVVFSSDDPAILELGKVEADQLVKVSVEEEK